MLLACSSHAQQSSLDEQAKFLSGVVVGPASPLAALQQEPLYQEHAREYVPAWRRFDEFHFGRMRAWAAGEVLPKTGNPKALYYLFAGPDFINAYALFPDAPVYILGGLEPVGFVVPPERLDPARIAEGLANLRQTTSVILRFSHFITKDMRAELDRTDFRGVLPILYSFLALGGGEILNAGYIVIDASGNMRDAAGPAPGKGLLPGVRIVFRKHSAAPPQTLYYVEANLENDALGRKAPLLSWMAKFGPGVSYLKAASYLLHENGFSKVRQFLLDHSTAILEDDSGIPLRYLAGDQWRIYLFGKYSGTLDIFQKYFQPDMISAYGTNAAAALPFGTGYKWQPGESNLMLAVRQRGPLRAAPAAPLPVAQPLPAAPADPETATDVYPPR